MKAVLFPGGKQVQIVERPVPQPEADEVLIRTRASALCRSDMSLYNGNPIVGGDATLTGQIIPGHEAAGEVVQVGQGVTEVKAGDRVAVYLAFGCGSCTHCRNGDLMLCDQWKCLGFDLNGGDADYVIAPAYNCLKLPDTLSFEAGAVMTDMVGTQYHTQKRLDISGTDTVAIFGIGPMGSAGILIAKGRGARVIAVDVLDSRLEMAKQLGADEVVNSSTENAVERLRALTGGRGVDAAIDCSGHPVAQNAALDAARKLGKVAFVGESRSTTINPSDQMIRKLLTVIGAWYFPIGEWTELVNFVVERQIAVDKMITHRFSLDHAAEAFQLFDQRQTGKVVFVWD
ncbi:zinc-binding dehydrogenase [Candidatus Flexifilum breve]|uniref:zinc-dependent alcohol dehydrogenase family protein n=1 Tax=Candidatus Flexifilum breve TaxID=3140694 RepID=UPI0031CC69C7